ncbi:hypothetical protein [Pseudomonas sp.]|uniref:hypothetical protein n=1 Tax=Pseudomonas sp. TaxID=306 RepID=UPI003FD77B10
MASITDICNLALSNIGDTATVVSISPPSGSVQAVHCARFYPVALNAILEMHTWDFAVKRVSLALLSETPPSPWRYAYTAPGDALNLLSILDPAATDDYSAGLIQYGSYQGPPGAMVSIYTTQPFTSEVDPTGTQVIYTNQQNAILRYSGATTDTTTFSPLFIMALGYLLGSMLAGPVIKGAEGRAEAKAQYQLFKASMAEAVESDANQRNIKPTASVGWIANR